MNRVVVTGIGAVTPLGNNVPTFWNNIIEGKSGSNYITRFDASKFRTQFACEIKDFPKDKLDKNTLRKTDLFTQYALVATDEAVMDSGIDFSKMNPFDIGVIWGTGQGGMETFENQVTEYTQSDGTPKFSPFFIPKLIANMASGMISMRHGLMGINYTTVSACATSNSAIMDAFNYIRLGKAKMIISGGSEAPITPASFGGFCAMKAMSTRNDNPAEASKPFDIDRDGFVMGEGAGALILEDREHAMNRGAKIYGEILGAAMTADAYHLTAPREDGLGAKESMRRALEDGQLTMENVDYLNVHGTSTPVGDILELKAASSLTKKKLTVSSTKSMTGHLLGAAGAIEAIVCILSIQNECIPPTINTLNLDPEIPQNVEVVIKETKSKKIDIAISNVFGFGGHNATVVFGKNK